MPPAARSVDAVVYVREMLPVRPGGYKLAELLVSNPHHWILITHGYIVKDRDQKSAADPDRSMPLDPCEGHHT